MGAIRVLGRSGGSSINKAELFAYYSGIVEDSYLVDSSGMRSDTPEPGRSLIPHTTTTFLTHPNLNENSTIILVKERTLLPIYTISTGQIAFNNTSPLYHFKIYFEGQLWGEYPLCESSGNTVHDISGNGRHLTLTIGSGSWGTQSVIRNYVNEFGYNLNGSVRIPALNDNTDVLGNPLIYKGKVRRNAQLLDGSFNAVGSVEDAVYVNFNPHNIVEEGFDYMNRANTTYFVTSLNSSIYNSNNYTWAKTELVNSFVKNKLHAFNFNKIYIESISKIAISKSNFSNQNISALKFGSEKSKLGNQFKNLFHWFDNDAAKIDSSFSWADKIWSGVAVKNTNAATNPSFVNNEVQFNVSAANRWASLDDVVSLNKQGTFIFQGKFPNDNRVIIGRATGGQSYILKHTTYFSILLFGTSPINVPITVDGNEHVIVITYAGGGFWIYLDGVLYLGRKDLGTNDLVMKYSTIGATDTGGFAFGGTLKKVLTFTKPILNASELNYISSNLFGINVNYEKAVNIHYSGDSITNGYGLASPTTERFADKIMAAVNNSSYIMNAVTGARALRALFSMGANLSYNYVPGCENNIFVEFMGANDISVDEVPQKIYDAKKAQCLMAKSYGYKVVCVGVLPRTVNSSEHLTSWNGVNQLLRDNHTFCDVFVDVALDPVIGVAGSQNNLTYYQDGTHPTAAGHVELKRLVQPAIESLIE